MRLGVGGVSLHALLRWAPLAAFVVFALWLGPSQAGNRKWLDLGVEAMVLAGAATGVNILVGYAGLLSLGHAGFFVAGGYAGAVLGPHMLGDGSVMPEFMVRNGPWFGPLFALVAGVGLGVVLALACCHLRGFHLTAVTLGFGALVPAVVVLAADQLGGLGGRTVERVPDTRNAFLARGNLLAGVYYTAVVFALVVLWMVWNLTRSRWGRALMAVRDGEVAARTSGIHPYRSRVAAFALSAGIVAVAGWVSAVRTLSVSSGSAIDVQTESFRYVVMVAVGGAGTVAGPVIGAFAVTFGLGVDVFQDHLRDKLGLVFGVIALAVVTVAPSGLAGAARRLAPSVIPAGQRRAPGGEALPPAAHPSVSPQGVGAAHGATREAGPEAGRETPVLRLRGLTRSFGGVRALDGFDLDVAAGSVHAVVGPNGSGKSTLVNVVTGVEPAASGRIELAGRDVTGLPAHRRAAAGMARTFQGVRVWPRMTVLDNVLAGAHTRGSACLARCLVGLAGREERRLRRRAAELLTLVGLAHRSTDRAGQLTLAEQGRLELARALAAQPRLLLLDEPAAGLGPAEVDALVALLVSLRAQGQAIVLVEHHVDAVFALADMVTVLHNGVTLAQGRPAEVRRHPGVQEAYLGPGGALGPD